MRRTIGRKAVALCGALAGCATVTGDDSSTGWMRRST